MTDPTLLSSHRPVHYCTPALVHQALAVDVSLAALLGEQVYSFGELLLHPIVRANLGGLDFVWGCSGMWSRERGHGVWPPTCFSHRHLSQVEVLRDGAFAWLYDLLQAFNKGRRAGRGNAVYCGVQLGIPCAYSVDEATCA